MIELLEMPKRRNIEQVMEIVHELQKWIDDREGLSVSQLAGMNVTTDTLDVFIGDVIVWSSYDDDYADLTIEHCRDMFLKHVESFRPFFSELPERGQQ